ncbi:MAG: NAD(P)/FAD-dependent oxidoreductase [Opitutales bacterium]|nr:NAD(P)/FAD-dependent oxidoreductase [Opitutales bacterium]
MRYGTIIIGAGMSGMAAAIRLARFGESVLLLERHYVVGGLNSFYFRNGRKYDVGLHAMTNFVPAGTKNAPLTRLLRQLRIRYEELDLCEQNGSEIHCFGNKICFTNDFSLFESEIARCFPSQMDGFRRLNAFLDSFDEASLEADESSARAVVGSYITDPLLLDTLFLPLSYYGSSTEDDMSFPQFAIMYRSIFKEGFARPHIGVRQIISILREKLREAGATIRMKCGVKRILTTGTRVCGVELDNGEIIEADRILSSAGAVETERLIDGVPADAGADNIGKLAFCETIAQSRLVPAKDMSWTQTIIFFNDAERFHYRTPAGLIDPRSGVICIPNNYRWRDESLAPQEGCLRVSCLANNDAWAALGHATPAYLDAKAQAFQRLQETALMHLAPFSHERFAASLVDTDMFTPLTLTRFAGKLGGATYGATRKNRAGTTRFENLFICGTDQGFLGITGALLSGISIANARCLI